MNKVWLGLIVAFLLSIGTMGFLPSETEAEGFSDVKLTEEQQKEMAILQKEAFNQKKEIINKYVEYGVFNEEKGLKMISKFEDHYNKLEQNDFVPKWDQHHKKHHKKD
ncbi:DUF2680 domain-containing protein [Halobacillus seohaensis]|uniref:DUF2680 domain-containing protein n=1 Tax=Halobacillus seohaensis TaxID=447421 RepID=A0ABW2EH75_9BACI